MQGAKQINSMDQNGDWRHGTAVWGEIKGEHDSQGVRGGAVAVTPIVANVFDAENRVLRVAVVIAQAADLLQAGDVILIEREYKITDGDGVPVEYYPAEWAAIRSAVDKGIVVVEAGANGQVDLDTVRDGRFKRGHANFADSGAIMVGGARHNQRTWIGSSFGSRIDVQGWYDWSVATTGYGYLHGSSGDNDAYTDEFAGTSSASPLVTAAAAVMQSVARLSLGRVLEPDELRELMVKTGTPQPVGDAATHNVGPQPNLKWALAALSNERAMHGGCCQRSLTDNNVAWWEYLNGVPIALESKTIECGSLTWSCVTLAVGLCGTWMPHYTYSPTTKTCENLCTYIFTSKAYLKTAVVAFNANAASAIATYGPIADWCVSAITDMSSLFYHLKNFNADISNWDTSGVTDMGQMFAFASAFNQPLIIDTSSVTTMYHMFSQASAFNQPLSFDTSSVTTMRWMFSVRSAPCPVPPKCSRALPCTCLRRRRPPPSHRPAARPAHVCPRFDSRQSASAFNQPLSFDTSSVTGMSWMFYVRSSPCPAPSLQSSPPLHAASTAIAHHFRPPGTLHLAPHRMPSVLTLCSKRRRSTSR